MLPALILVMPLFCFVLPATAAILKLSCNDFKAMTFRWGTFCFFKRTTKPYKLSWFERVLGGGVQVGLLYMPQWTFPPTAFDFRCKSVVVLTMQCKLSRNRFSASCHFPLRSGRFYDECSHTDRPKYCNTNNTIFWWVTFTLTP